jgi:hypothetical protein
MANSFQFVKNKILNFPKTYTRGKINHTFKLFVIVNIVPLTRLKKINTQQMQIHQEWEHTFQIGSIFCFIDDTHREVSIPGKKL